MPFAPTRLAKVKKSDDTTCWWGWIPGNARPSEQECRRERPLCSRFWHHVASLMALQLHFQPRALDRQAPRPPVGRNRALLGRVAWAVTNQKKPYVLTPSEGRWRPWAFSHLGQDMAMTMALCCRCQCVSLSSDHCSRMGTSDSLVMRETRRKDTFFWRGWVTFEEHVPEVIYCQIKMHSSERMISLLTFHVLVFLFY